ncbi:hypothetical protein AQUCO_04900197v1 [Aquilegia coerulea]|uniref:Uncharacterized protein n=1 Tax=Aquilegia coerulea TaxID=218851 RepID=A0A2G5CKD5_AQUCA|nr:hypothetical protein AQUCO_04900197v1 [Aquilegia coerulea]
MEKYLITCEYVKKMKRLKLNYEMKKQNTLSRVINAVNSITHHSVSLSGSKREREKEKMGEALFELEQVLRSKKITVEEEDLLSMCKGKAVKNFTFSSLISSAIAWTALRKFGYGFRVNVTGGVGLITGMWRFDKALYSCVENILAMDGTRLQAELTNVSMQHIRKHFYLENVFDDFTSERPKIRWRQRNYFSDNVAFSQRSHDNDTNDDSTHLEMKQPPEPKQFSVQPTIELSSDPLGCVLGYSVPLEEIHHPATTTENATKRRARSHKRSHRRHRTRHAEVE